MSLLDHPQRQSPWAIVFFGLTLVASVGGIQLAVAAIVFFTASANTAVLIIAPLVAAVVIGAAVLSWWRFTFCIVGDEFVVNSGVLRRDRLSVPIDRIQSISTEQRLIHRLVGVVRVSLETAGTDETEFRLHAVERTVADDLRHRTGRPALRTEATPDDPIDETTLDAPAEAATVVLQHSPARLLLAAVTSWPLAGLVALGSVFAALGQVGDDVPVRPPTIDGDDVRWWWVPIGLLSLLVTAVVLNVVRIVLRDWDHTVEVDGQQLRRTSGLLSRRLDTRAVSKVQVVSTSQNPLQQAVRLSEVDLSSVGDGGLDVLGCDADERAEIVRRSGLTPTADLAPAGRIHPAEIWRALQWTTSISTVIAILAWLVVGRWALLLGLAIPIVGVLRWLHVRHFRWGLTQDELVTRGRVVDTWTEQCLLRKTNGVQLRRTWFERRRGLATVSLRTASGEIEIGMLPLDEAMLLRDRIAAAVVGDDRAWM